MCRPPTGGRRRARCSVHELLCGIICSLRLCNSFQVVVPVNCRCDADLGHAILSLRSQTNHSPSVKDGSVTVMAYGFPHSSTAPTTNLGIGSGYDNPDQRSYPNPATASSLVSLARTIRGSPTSGCIAPIATMWCPGPASVLGTMHPPPLPGHRSMDCPHELRQGKRCHTVRCKQKTCTHGSAWHQISTLPLAPHHSTSQSIAAVRTSYHHTTSHTHTQPYRSLTEPR